MISTSEAAARARLLHSLAPVGTNQRRAAGVAAVLLDSARTHAGARRMLAQHRIPDEVRANVQQLLAELEGTSAGAALNDLADGAEQAAPEDAPR